VTAVNAVSAISVTTLVTIEEAIAGLDITLSSDTVAIGQSVTFTAVTTAGTNILYNWDFGDGQVDVGQVVMHQYNASGTYTATVTAVNSVSTISTTTIVNIEDAVQYEIYLPIILKPN
ncbi:MAG: PKD domain-containing protein, partial [Chloroflexi bacterium]|nr:PKD domain-containing protein [Chloroflexota bacterium]